MSEAVARVAKDIKTGRVLDPADGAKAKHQSALQDLKDVHKSLLMIASEFPCPVIDSTPMYHQIVSSGTPVELYEEYRCLPVWENALIGYENEWGNVSIIQTYVIDKEQHYWEPNEWEKDTKPPYEWETENPVDWNEVRYRFIGCLWIGGLSLGKHVQTRGPIYRWDIAAYEDGQMADIRWIALYNSPEDENNEATYQNAMMVWLQTYTLAGCSNVELVTPLRSKPERKRLERMGIDLKTIVIKKTSKSYRHSNSDTTDVIDGVPQRFVRGHYARYGEEYGRGLLFGKYSGKFWIPARAVGDSGREIDYTTGEQ